MPRLICLFALGLGLFAAPARVRGQLVMSEILFDPVGSNTGRQVVEIRNLGPLEVSMGPSGYWLYFPPSQWQFPSGITVAAGATITVHINRPGTNSDGSFFTGISGMRNLRGQGAQGDAIGLFSTNLFGDSSKLVDFVQWGGAGNGGEEVAVAAGIWPASGFVGIGVLREGSTIAYDGSGKSPSDWCIDGTPTIGAANDACTTSFSRSSVILNEIGYVHTGPNQYHWAVELKNVGDVLEDLAGKRIVLGGQQSYRFPVGTPDTLIGPGEIAVLHCGVAGTDGEFQFYAGVGSFRDLQSSDSVSFHSEEPFTDATTVIDFVQWGTVSSPLEAAAVTAQAWKAGERVDATDRRAKGSVAAHNADRAASRWHIDNTSTIGQENGALPEVPVVINELLIDPSGANQGRTQVELRNLYTGEAVSLAGWKICFESITSPGTARCFAFPAQTSIPAAGFLTVSLNRTAIPKPCEIFTGAFQDLEAARGSVSLFVSLKETDENNLVDYVRWGADPGFGEELAVAAGIWTAGQSVDVTAALDGNSIAYNGEGDVPESYRIDRDPSICKDNVEGPRQAPFRRGDCNDEGKVDLSDAISVLNFLFAGGKASLCANACDMNDDEQLDISDAVFLLGYLFGGGPEPPEPGHDGTCAPDQDPLDADHLTCGSFLSC